jgi:hypothetical protein
MNHITPPARAIGKSPSRRWLACLLALTGSILPITAQSISYNFNDGLQGWTQLWPTPPGVLWEGAALGSGHDGGETRFARSPEFYITGSGPLSFSLRGGQSPLDTPAAPSAIPEIAINGGGFGGVALRDVTTDTYVLWRRKPGNGDAGVPLEFSPSELTPFRNDGKKYTLDYIDYNKGGWGWTYLDDVSIPGIEIEPPAPTGVTLTAGSKTLVIEWSPAPRASSYEIQRSPAGADTFTTVGEIAGTRFTDPNLPVSVSYDYRVIAENSTGASPVSSTVTGAAAGGPESSDKDILTFSFGSFGDAIISGTTITKYLPISTNVSALTPAVTTSLFSTSNPSSGAPRNFAFPQTYTITAEDGTTKNYTVTVNLVTALTYDFNTGLQGWSQIYPVSGVLLQNNALGSGYDNDDTFSRFARSPGFYLLDSGPITFFLDGGQSPLAAPAAPSAIPANAINGGGFAGMALRDVETDTYVLWRRKNGNGGGFQLHQFSVAELAPYVNNGRQYTLDYLDYNSGGWGWTYMDNVSIPGLLEEPGTEALLTSAKFSPASTSETFGNFIDIWVPENTDVSALAPQIAISPEASISPPHGTIRDFTTPQEYTVTSGDGLVVNTYTITVFPNGSLSVKTFDTIEGPGYLAPISNLQALTPTATGIQVNDIFYGDFTANLPGLTGNETFSVLWEGWFNVSLNGPGFYTFGSQSDDGSMIYLDINDDGDFSDPGELVVNNNGYHGYNIATGSVYLGMDSVKIAIGYFEAGGGEGLDARFLSGANQPFSSLARIGGKSGHFSINRPAADTSSTALWNLQAAGVTATQNGNQIYLNLPPEVDITTVAPTFLLAPGAVSVPASGTPLDFTNPQTYSVTSDDDSTTTEYVVTIRNTGALNVRTYDTISGTNLLAPISNLEAQTPTATFIAPNDISFTTFNPATPGLTNGDTFAILWDGWFDVAEEGPGFYTFGTSSDDGSVIYLDLNNDGDFDDASELIVNNNAVQGITTRTATVWLPMDKIRIAIGYFEEGGGEVMIARYAKGQNIPFTQMNLIGGSIGTFFATEPASEPSSAALWYLSYFGPPAVVDGTNLQLSVPVGTDITNLDPTFEISPGATCVPPSGTTRDFSTPQTYTVTSDDESTTTVYTVSVYQRADFTFNSGTLDGWSNRVWDLAANGGSGGWINLSPNATTLPPGINGGEIQPPSPNNGLFATITSQVRVSGNIDTHLNTHWLRSPAFVLDAVANLTVDLGMGIANTTDPLDESEIPHEAVTGGGWKGIALRRVSDGAFLIAKPRTGANNDVFRTITFTQEELEPFDGIECTLDLINSDRGSWGWIAMDNVSIPVESLTTSSPYETWIANYPSLVGGDTEPGADPDNDGLTNLEELAFNTDPTSGITNTLAFDLGTITNPGSPFIETDGGFSFIFARRIDRVDQGLTYTVQFSHDLDTWVDDATEPTVLASDADIEAVEVPFPATITTPGGPQVPQFARVQIIRN